MATTERIQALIVDDEPLARANLRHALEGFRTWQVAGERESVASAKVFLASQRVDVVFLDVQMPAASGLVLARHLATLEEPPIVIFVSAFGGFALEAFELHALDYLLKPFDDLRFAQCIERAEWLLQLRERAAYAGALRGYFADADRVADVPSTFLTRMSVRSVGRIESIGVDEVRWFFAAGNYVELHLANRMVLHRVTISALERRLDPAVFLRVHRSAIVRRDDVATLTVTGDGTYLLKLRSGGRVAVSERYVASVREELGE